MKKHRYTAAAVMLSLSMLTSAAAADYSDLKPHWAEQAMEFAVQSNLMDGISEYTFAAVQYRDVGIQWEDRSLQVCQLNGSRRIFAGI